jgi:DNA-binding CsgD family transcriptional regulator/tetratricopeptide (TPR) repeat protein
MGPMDNRVVAARVSSPDLIGRGPELSTLEAAVQRAGDGIPGVVVIAGESGVGKSRLVASLAEQVRRDGDVVLTGECIELSEGEIPFAPVVSALRHLARDLPDEVLDAIFGEPSSEMIRLFPDIARGAIPGPNSLGLGSVGQARLFEFLLGIFQRLAMRHTVMLVIEDLHWADRSTRDLLFFLARSMRDERFLLVVTYRSDELHRRHPLRPFLPQLLAARGVERIELTPLTRDEVCDQLERIVGQRADDELTEAIYARSEGNPLFTEELIAASADGSSALPDTLRDALLLRVEALPEQAQQLARIAAAAGRRAQHDLIAAVVDLPEDELLEAVREAVGGHVLVEAGDDDSYEFRHALLREAVYSDLLPGERTKLHVALARAIEADPVLAGQDATRAAELAHHWYAAHNLQRALRASIEAGRESEAIYAFAEAHRHYERALELWDCVDGEMPAERPEVLRLAAAAAHSAGEVPRAVALARDLVDELDETTEPEAAALALERLARYLWTDGRGEEALPIYRRAVAVLPDTPSAALARALAGEAQALMLLDDPNASRELCEKALPIARAAGARHAEASILNTLIACAGGHENNTIAAIELMDEARAIAEELGLAEELLRAYMNGSDALDEAGRVEDALDLVLAGVDAARRMGLERYFGYLLQGEAAGRLLRLGRFDEVVELADSVIAAGAIPLSLISSQDARAVVAMERGDFEHALALLDDAASAMTRHGGSMWLAQAANPLSRLALRERRSDDARTIAQDALGQLADGEYVFFTAPLYWAAVSAEADTTELARPLRDDDAIAASERRATQLLERFDRQTARYVAHPVPPQVLAWRSMAAAEMSRLRGESEPAAWADAAERFEALGQIADAAHARYRHAEALAHARTGREETRIALLRGRSIAERLGMAPLLEQIDGLARRARIKLDNAEPPVAAEPQGPASELGLTDRELEVLGLVAKGCTNREIGERLYMSEKTASVHVSRILAKLRASNRAEAAASAERLGLVGE